MKIGILKTGVVDGALAERFGAYPDLYAALLRRAAPEAEFETWRVIDGVLPEHPDLCDGWLVTGSRAGVYEDDPWIAPLEAFLRAAHARSAPIIGVCFGHQVLARALGGAVEKWSGGWNLGLTEYETRALPSWMADAPARLALHAVHQDQIVAPPPGATIIASAPRCAVAALLYGDPEAPTAISIQPHPEFDTAFMRELVARRRGVAFGDEDADAALASLGDAADMDWAARWFGDFLTAAIARRGAKAA